MRTRSINWWGNTAMPVLVLVCLFVLVGCASKGGVTAAAGGTATPLPPVQKSGSDVFVDAQVLPVRNATLSFSNPGVVKEILVKEGDTVKAGQVLANLTGKDRLEAAVTAAQTAVINARQGLKNLNDNTALAKSAAELEVAQAKINLDDAVKERDRKVNGLIRQATLDELRANYILAKKAVEDAQDVYDLVKDRADDDANRAQALSLLARARNNYDKSLWNLNYALGLPDPKLAEKAVAGLSVAQARLDDAQKKLDEVKNGPKPDDLELANAQLANSEQQLKAAQAALDDNELKAPFDGSVASIEMEVGEYVAPGKSVVELGDLSHLQIETTNLTELNIVGVLPGNPVTVKFDAVPGLELTGKVIKIKQLGVNNRGDINFTVLIEPDTQDSRLLWGMTASVKLQK
jgi:HlyD family secretion protein